MLKGQLCLDNLASAGCTTQVMNQFDALGQCARRRSLSQRKQPTGWIDDQITIVGVVAIFDQLFATTFRTETQRLVKK
ncbi:hypothetical protein D3C75_1236820 [compost metagenome]